MFSSISSFLCRSFKASNATKPLRSLQRRGFSCCQTLNNKNDIVITKKLQRMLNRGNKKTKKMSYPLPIFKLSPDLESPSVPQKRPVKNNSQRAHKVSAVLHGHIEDIMANQELHPVITELNVQIVEVKVSKDLGSVTIYWSGKSKESENEEIEKALEICAKKLRDMLITRQVFGHIPFITFTKDKTEAYLEKIDRLLATADYGPGYTPGRWRTAYPDLPTLGDNEELQAEGEEDSVPDFSHVNNDIYGLDHGAMIKRLHTSMGKIKSRTKGSDTGLAQNEEILEKPKFIKTALRKDFEMKKKLKKHQKTSKVFDLSGYDSDTSDYFETDDNSHYDTNDDYDYDDNDNHDDYADDDDGRYR